ncbi:hypothetical protein GCM10027200_65490 [Lentzea nigeriaca]
MALAEHLRATLITCDVRLASAPGAKRTFDVISQLSLSTICFAVLAGMAKPIPTLPASPLLAAGE